MKNYKLSLTILAILFMFIVSCKTEKGEVGPAGPTGATGAPGATGATGATGTANVIYSNWITTSFSGTPGLYLGNITAPKITQDVLDKADIRVYWSESGRVVSLPYAQVIGGTTYTIHQRFYVGKIELVASYLLANQQFRYVIIPGGVAGGRKAAIDYSNYEEVKKYYNIPD